MIHGVLDICPGNIYLFGPNLSWFWTKIFYRLFFDLSFFQAHNIFEPESFLPSFLDSKCFGPINCLDPKIFFEHILQTNFLDQAFLPKFFFTHNFVEPNIFRNKLFRTTHFLWTQHFLLYPTLFLTQHFLYPQFFCNRILLDPNFWTQNLLDPNHFSNSM